MENAVRQVLGDKFIDEGRFHTCQWHFKSDMKKRENLLQEEDTALFGKAIHEICSAPTVAQYQTLFAALRSISERNNNCLHHSLAWWDARKHNLFPAFTATRTPGVSLAEWGTLDGESAILQS